MWMHFVTYCLEVDHFNNNSIKSAEIRAHAHPDYLHSSDARFFVDMTNGRFKPCENTLFFDESIPLNPFINNVRLEVFKTLSVGKSVKSSIDMFDKHSPACLILPSTIRAADPIPNLCFDCTQSHPSKNLISLGDTEKCNEFCEVATTSGIFDSPTFTQQLPSKIGKFLCVEQTERNHKQCSRDNMTINSQFCTRTNSFSIDLSNSTKTNVDNRQDFASIGMALKSTQRSSTPTMKDQIDQRKISYPSSNSYSPTPYFSTMKCLDREEVNFENIEDDLFINDLRYDTSAVGMDSLKSLVQNGRHENFYQHYGENEKFEEERKSIVDQSLYLRSRAYSPSYINSDSSDRDKETVEYNVNRSGFKSYNNEKSWIVQNRNNYSSPYQFSSYGIASPSTVSAISGNSTVGSHNYNQKLMNRVAEYEGIVNTKRSQGQGQGQNIGREFYFSQN